MTIQAQKVITLNYTLRDKAGVVIDQSQDGSFCYLHGANNIIPGLERALTGKVAGDKLKVTVPPEEAYGEREEGMVQLIPRERFEPGVEIEVGMQFQTPTEDGVSVVTVTKVENDSVTIDANHPLAGVTLLFSVEVMEVRDASAEELSHGHVHGAGGHHH